MKFAPTYRIQNGTLYLNNSGHRWIQIVNNQKEKVFAYINGELIERTAIFYESFGNFASVTISYKGRKISILEFSNDASKLDVKCHNNIVEIPASFTFDHTTKKLVQD